CQGPRGGSRKSAKGAGRFTHGTQGQSPAGAGASAGVLVNLEPARSQDYRERRRSATASGHRCDRRSYQQTPPDIGGLAFPVFNLPAREPGVLQFTSLTLSRRLNESTCKNHKGRIGKGLREPSRVSPASSADTP